MTVPSPEIQILWAVPVRFMRVSDLIEEVDLVFWKEKGDRHRVYRCVAPSLSERQRGIRDISVRSRSNGAWIRGLYLVIKSAGALEVIHVSSVGFASPELHIRDLHVTPIYQVSATGSSHK